MVDADHPMSTSTTSSLQFLRTPLLDMIENRGNFETFRDCLCGPILQQDAAKSSRSPGMKSRRGRKNTSYRSTKHAGYEIESETSDAEELADFVDV